MRILTEPLLHFLLIGAAIFLLVAITTDVAEERSDRIVVTEGQLERLAAMWQRTWQRPPTETELEGLIEDHITEEMLYREALALGLEKDDTIIRRRLRQKMEFLAQDLAPVGEPTEDQLRAQLDENAEDYRLPARFSFVHIFFSPDRRGEAVVSDAAAELARLEGPDPLDIDSLGDPLPLPRVFEDVDETRVTSTFGHGFAEQLAGVRVGQWGGPIRSGYGLHLVWVDAYTPSRPAELDEVRERLRQDWTVAEGDRRKQAFVDAIRERYEVIVERPGTTPVQDTANR